MKTKYSPEQINQILAEAKMPNANITKLCKEKWGISPNTYYTWKKNVREVVLTEPVKVRELEALIQVLEKIVAQQAVELAKTKGRDFQPLP